jgi:hypothetical protein
LLIGPAAAAIAQSLPRESRPICRIGVARGGVAESVRRGIPIIAR